MNRLALFNIIVKNKSEINALINQRLTQSTMEYSIESIYNHFIAWVLLNRLSTTESELLDVAVSIIDRIVSAREQLGTVTEYTTNRDESTIYVDTRLEELTIMDVQVIIDTHVRASERLLFKLYWHGTFKYNLVEADLVGADRWKDLGIERLDHLYRYLESMLHRNVRSNSNSHAIAELTGIRANKIHNRVRWMQTKQVADIVPAYMRYVK
jgi:hypothetical protein